MHVATRLLPAKQNKGDDAVRPPVRGDSGDRTHHQAEMDLRGENLLAPLPNDHVEHPKFDLHEGGGHLIGPLGAGEQHVLAIQAHIIAIVAFNLGPKRILGRGRGTLVLP